MTVEVCDQCGFDGGHWTDAQAVGAIAELTHRWTAAIEGLSAEDLGRRPVADLWSIAEYTDHVREVVFGMRFILDMALTEPGSHLGEVPEPPFDDVPRTIDVDQAVGALGAEVRQLHERLELLPSDAWASSVFAGQEVDVHWIARHAIHDVTHHLADVGLLRSGLSG